MGTAWQCTRCGATSRAELNELCNAPLLDWCPGFVGVELTEYPNGKTCEGYVESFAPDSKAIYDALVRRPTNLEGRSS